MYKVIILTLFLSGCATMEELGESVILTVPFVAAAVLIR